MTGLKFMSVICGRPGQPTMPLVKRLSLYSFLGLWMQLVVIRMAPGKSGKLPDLILPCGAVVPIEVLVFLQRRVTMGGQHLPVGVDVDALALRLLQKRFEVLQVMSGHQNGLAFLVTQRTLVGTG